MRDVPTGVYNAMQSGTFRPIFFVKIAFDTPLRFCSAVSVVTFQGEQYLGAGQVGKISSFRENTALEPNQMNITLSGMTQAVLNAVSDSNYINRDVTIRLGTLDENGVVIDDDAMFYFIGKTDEVKYTYGKSSKIDVIARSRLADWSRPVVERNINADQQAKYPGDKGFEFVGQVASKKIIWPKGEYYE